MFKDGLVKTAEKGQKKVINSFCIPSLPNVEKMDRQEDVSAQRPGQLKRLLVLS